jgi:beta-aspartyl-peptidase (threonine type)
VKAPGQVRQHRRGSGGGFSGRRLFILSSFLLLLFSGACEFQNQAEPEASEADVPGGSPAAEIQEMLLASAASWNAGDLDGFLDDYWRSDELTFSGDTGVTRGWDDVRTRYLNSYWAPGASRDSLRFEGIEVTPLGSDHALALGQYVLYRPEEGGRVTSSGFFSLVLWKPNGHWKILHDHTSAASPDEETVGGTS